MIKVGRVMWKDHFGGEIWLLSTAKNDVLLPHQRAALDSEEFILRWKLPKAEHMTDNTVQTACNELFNYVH